ncbi:esterase lipoprotein [Nannochloropsis oceanica]
MMHQCVLLTTGVLLAAVSATTTSMTHESEPQHQSLRGVRRALQWGWPSIFPDIIEEGEAEIESGVTDVPLNKIMGEQVKAESGGAILLEGKSREGVWVLADTMVKEEEHNINIPRTAMLGGERPAKVVLPDNYPQKSEHNDKKLWPMILMLHGYGSDAPYHDHFLGLSERVNQHGHSNGGAMTQILGCDHAELFAALASVTPGEIPSVCAPSHPVSVLEVCASKDPIVKLDLCTSVIENWTLNDGCAKKPTFEKTRDYDCDLSKPVDDNKGYDQWRDHNCMLSGNETEMSGWTCEGGSEVEFWWMRGAMHDPAFSSQWSDDVVAWLMSKTYVEA